VASFTHKLVVHLQWDVTLVAGRLRDFHTPKHQLTFCIHSMGTLWHENLATSCNLRFNPNSKFRCYTMLPLHISTMVIPSISNSQNFAISGALRLLYAPDFPMLGKYESAAQHHTNNHSSNDYFFVVSTTVPFKVDISSFQLSLIKR